jgi:hypothetical protein
MEALSAIERIVRDLLVFIVAMSAILAALLVVISRMPGDNPLKRIMVALSYRVGATAAAGMLGIPVPRSPASMRSSTSARRSPSSGIGGPSSATRDAAARRRPRGRPPDRADRGSLRHEIC